MSTDSVEANAAFAAKHDFPFPLLSDTKREICTAYGACERPYELTAKRITCVIDPDGIVQRVYAHVDAEEHPAALLAALDASSDASVRPAQQVDAAVHAPPSHTCSYEVITPEGKPDMPDTYKEAEKARQEEHSDGTPPDEQGTVVPVEAAALPSAAPLFSAPTPGAALSLSRTAPEARGLRAGASPTLVYALGTLGFDFGSEARYDAFRQAMGKGKIPHDPKQLLAYLEDNPWHAAGVIWTLNLDETPVYALQPAGAFAELTYNRLRASLQEQCDGTVERIAAPGMVVGQARLLSGQEVPVLWPEIRGLASWSTAVLVETVCGEPPGEDADEETRQAYARQAAGVRNFLERVYHELRNVGVTPRDRALNYAATNVFQAGRVFVEAAREELMLDRIGVERSPHCRPDSDCWDVKLTFFDPKQRLARARQAYRFTVDVSDVTPVMVGAIRSWAEY